MDSLDFKAHKFLGYFSLRTGTCIAGFIEILVGLTIWLMLSQIRPQLRLIGNMYMLAYFIIGCTGIVGGVRRSPRCTWVFFVLLLCSVVMSGLLGCEFLDVFHFLPQPPKHPTTDKDTVPLSAAANITPLNGVIKTDPKVLEEKQQARSESVQKQKLKKAAKDEENLEKKAAKLKQKYVQTKEKEKNSANEGRSFFIEMTPRQRRVRKKSATNRGDDWASVLDSAADHAGWVRFGTDDDQGDVDEALSKKSEAGTPAKGVAEEEISVDELPGVYSELSDEGQKLVQAQMKNIKHIAKVCCGATLMVLTGLRLYPLWTTFSWAMNKCISFDVLEDAPDQFDALMDAADNTNIGAADLQLDIDDNTPLNTGAPSL